MLVQWMGGGHACLLPACRLPAIVIWQADVQLKKDVHEKLKPCISGVTGGKSYSITQLYHFMCMYFGKAQI